MATEIYKLKAELLERINSTAFWHKVPGGVTPSQKIVLDASPSTIYHVNDFGLIDERLPEVIEELVSLFSTKLITDALHFWEMPKLCLPRINNDVSENAEKKYIKHFRSFTWDGPTGDVTIKYVSFEIRKTASGIMYPDGSIHRTVDVPRAWLDEYLPDWASRYLAGLSLELEPKELTHFIMGQYEHRQAPDITGLSFD